MLSLPSGWSLVTIVLAALAGAAIPIARYDPRGSKALARAELLLEGLLASRGAAQGLEATRVLDPGISVTLATLNAVFQRAM